MRVLTITAFALFFPTCTFFAQEKLEPVEPLTHSHIVAQGSSYLGFTMSDLSRDIRMQIEDDLRKPSLENLSGAWLEVRVVNQLQLLVEQNGSLVSGVGLRPNRSSTRWGTPFGIEGVLQANELHLSFNESGSKKEIVFSVVKEGDSVLIKSENTDSVTRVFAPAYEYKIHIGNHMGNLLKTEPST